MGNLLGSERLIKPYVNTTDSVSFESKGHIVWIALSMIKVEIRTSSRIRSYSGIDTDAR